MTGALKVKVSTDPDVWTVIGGGSFATEAETVAGVLDDRAVTPAGLTAAIEAQPASLPVIDVRDYGAVGDGVADDTAALQAWATYVATNHKVGWLPNGTYRITAPITFPTAQSWAIEGENRMSTIIRQDTDNTPILVIGDTPGSQSQHSLRFRNLELQYLNAQAAANTAAVGMQWTAQIYNSEMSNLTFRKCAWGQKIVSGQVTPWGNSWDNLWYIDPGIGAINIADGISGAPGNKIGRLYIICQGSAPTGPLIDWIGVGTTFDSIEYNQVNAGNPRLFRLIGGSQVWFGALRLEGATYTTALALWDFTGSSLVQIGSVEVSGTVASFNPPAGQLFYAVQIGSGGGTGAVRIGHMRLKASSLSSQVAALGVPSTSRAIVDDVDLLNGWMLQSTGYSSASDYITVNSWSNGRLDVNGDADKTVALRDGTTQLFNTTFTAVRTITLPAKTSNLCSGLTYRIIANGAINGANTLVIREGATTLRTQTVDKAVIDYTWKRVAGAGAWVLTGYQLLP